MEAGLGLESERIGELERIGKQSERIGKNRKESERIGKNWKELESLEMERIGKNRKMQC